MTSAPPKPRCWFFLSYAHSQPLPGREETDTDGNVRIFFRHLSAEVAKLTGAREGATVGFFAGLAEPGSDWRAVQGEMLAVADVFVALHSPNYFNRSWPMREREAFLQRLSTVLPAPEQRLRHVVPVLWVPLPPWEDTPEHGAALALGQGVPEYAENGLRALCMLRGYEPAYRRILERLARHIVDVARTSPVRPSAPMRLDDVRIERQAVRPAGDTEKPFLVSVLCPTLDHLPPGRSATPYGATRQRWRPFGAMRELPVADYAANTAERRGLPTRIIDSTQDGAVELFDSCPTLLLVDPWTLATPGGGDVLTLVAKHLHPWVVCLVVADRQDPEHAGRGADLSAEVTARLGRVGARQIVTVLDVDELAYRMPAIVESTRKEYLSTGMVFPPQGPHETRPTLRGRQDGPGTTGREN
ncbi:TIR-like protein FxsC [Dactylosporangium sp. NPDC049525]|uniref:TIR-like protein FxsC n=1 Tax=Dactylosporangium sp. NPDC049525 TaxID=3154730 RepID=UPI003429BF27